MRNTVIPHSDDILFHPMAFFDLSILFFLCFADFFLGQYSQGGEIVLFELARSFEEDFSRIDTRIFNDFGQKDIEEHANFW